MTQDFRIHYAPRTAALNEEPHDILVPALMRLRRCTTAFDVVMLMQSLPDSILPELAWAASRKRFIPTVAVRALVKACGAAFLEGQLGRRRAHELMMHYAEGDVLSGL